MPTTGSAAKNNKERPPVFSKKQADARHQAVADAIEQASSGLLQLRKLMNTVDDLHFGRLHALFEHLETAYASKTVTDAAFAFMAQRDDAGRRVGSTRAEDYLSARLHITPQEARSRVERGEMLYSTEDDTEELDLGPEPEEPPAPSPEDSDKSEAEREEEEARRQEARRKAEEEAERRREKERAEKERLRERMKEEAAAQAKLLEMIEFELTRLNKYAVPGKNELYNKALDYSTKHDFDATRQWLRKEIRMANKNTRTPFSQRDPYADTRKRGISIGQPDSDGGCSIHGYLDRVTATLIKDALTPACRPGGPEIPPEEDNRTYKQRMHDQFAAVFAAWVAQRQDQTHGLGTFVISATVGQLAELNGDTYLPTSVGTQLSPSDLLRLGAAAQDYLLIMDDTSFHPLALGRSARTASLAQRVALAAAQMVCSHPDCQRPARECDVHHMLAYSYNGPTDINNLTLQCRSHHVNNNDHRDGYRNMGYADWDLESNRIGYRAANGNMSFNDSTWAGFGASSVLRSEVEASRAAFEAAASELADDSPPEPTGPPDPDPGSTEPPGPEPPPDEAAQTNSEYLPPPTEIPWWVESDFEDPEQATADDKQKGA